MSQHRLDRDVVALLEEASALKHVDRAGWKRVGVTHPESVAAHAYGVALAALLLAPASLDREKLLVMAILHDLAEIEVGDITPFDGISREEKHAREHAVMARLLEKRPDLLAIVEEAERGESPEARFLHALDKLDMTVMAGHYAAAGHDTRDFVASARPAIDAVFKKESADER